MTLEAPGPPPAPNPDHILVAEYTYIAQTAFQANEDRARVSTFYLVTLGSVVAALLSSQVLATARAEAYLAFAVLFAILTLFGLLTLLQLVRLRQAWFDSAQALNQVKRYYTQHGGLANLAEAFRWTDASLPRLYKPWSISFLLALQVALLSGVTCGAAVLNVGFMAQRWEWSLAIGAGTVLALAQMALYRRLLAHGPD